MAIDMDDSARPLLVLRFGADWGSDEFQRYLDWYRSQLARKQRFAAVFDATRARAPSAVERRLQAEFIRDTEPMMRAHCAGLAFAISSPIIRGALTAIFWVQPPVYTHTVVPTVSEATAWARQRLATLGASAG